MDSAVDDRIEQLVADFTLEAKVAQLIGWIPTEVQGNDTADLPVLRANVASGLGHLCALFEMGDADPEHAASKMHTVQRFLAANAPSGIPALVHGEALNGFVYAGAVQFPTPISMASTFRPEWARRAGAAAGRQMRALGLHQAFPPNLDVARDPRFGRVHETYGEDPQLCAVFGVEAVRGLQGAGILATAKHFLAYAIPEGGLNMGQVQLGPRELREVFATPFEAAIRLADLAGIMNSYSPIDGVPVTVDRSILTGLLREEMGFDGIVVSDANSIVHAHHLHGIGESVHQAGLLALTAGIDIELLTAVGFADLAAAVTRGELDETVVDTAVRRVLRAKARAGVLDGVAAPQPASFPATADEKAASQAAAHDAIVLLRNDGGALPLSQTAATVAVVGPFADRLRPMYGAYSGPSGIELIRQYRRLGLAGMADGDQEAPGTDELAGRDVFTDDELDAALAGLYPDGRTILAALREKAPASATLTHAKGADHFDEGPNGIREAVALASDADACVCVIGEKTGWTGDATAGEGRARSSTSLLGAQRELVEQLAATGTRLIVVVLCGRPLDISWLDELADAIVLGWHPATYGGQAIASVLWGQTNPGGKLPISWPRSVGHIPAHANHRRGSGARLPDGTLSPHQYVDAPHTPLYAFGHGLSYTTFAISALEVEHRAVPVGAQMVATVNVTNTGDVTGDEVVQFYGHDIAASVTRPVRQLLGFLRVTLAPGETGRLTLRVDSRVFALWGVDGGWKVEPGTIRLSVGTSSDREANALAVELTGNVLHVPRREVFVGEVSAESPDKSWRDPGPSADR